MTFSLGGEPMIAFRVDDMTCGHCVKAITQAVRDADAGAAVKATG